jgi:hypothetical protein
MATERQKAANRRNARKSTGPRWNGGKRRASRNSFRHGLSRPAALGKADEEWIERFARAAIKGCRSAVTLEPWALGSLRSIGARSHWPGESGNH